MNWPQFSPTVYWNVACSCCLFYYIGLLSVARPKKFESLQILSDIPFRQIPAKIDPSLQYTVYQLYCCCHSQNINSDDAIDNKNNKKPTIRWAFCTNLKVKTVYPPTGLSFRDLTLPRYFGHRCFLP